MDRDLVEIECCVVPSRPIDVYVNMDLVGMVCRTHSTDSYAYELDLVCIMDLSLLDMVCRTQSTD